MRITIDTNKDSTEEIEKVITLIREIIRTTNKEVNEDFSMPKDGIMGIFKSENSETPNEEKKDEDHSGIITY
jgi:hypothetical protein